jgi:flagellar basal-body rod protein FlgC
MEVNNVFGPVDIAVSGMRAQGKNIEIISSNVANSRTTDAGKGVPYRKLETVLKAETDGIGGVNIADIVQNMTDFQRIFNPGSPQADENGYVAMPNVHLPIEIMNLNIATRTYQANAAVLKRYQQMMETTLELLR